MSSEVLEAPFRGRPAQGRLRNLGRSAIENVRFAGLALIGHKLRSSLTILGIVIGVATVISMVSMIEGFNRNVIGELESYGATLVQFQKTEPRFGPGAQRDPAERLRKNLTYEDALALKAAVPDMAAVSPERYWSAGDRNEPMPNPKYKEREAQPEYIVGVNEDYLVANNQSVREGRFITSFDVEHSRQVVVIGSEIAEALFEGVDGLAKRIDVGGRDYTVVGVMESKGQSIVWTADRSLFLPITTFDNQFPNIKRTGDGVYICTIPRSPELMDKIMEEGIAVLRMRRKVPYNKPNDFGIYTSDQLVRSFKQITGGIALAMIFISSIALIVGGVGVMNVMLVSVTERTREIGIRKAIGAVPRDIVTQFLTEAVALTALGGAIGIALGLGISTLVRVASPLETATPMWAIMLGLGVSASIGLFFGIYPAYKAARLDAIDALRYE